MIRYLPKFLYVLSGSKLRLALILILFIVSSILEAVGISLVGPFIGLASQPESIQAIPLLDWIYQRSGITTNGKFIAALGFGLAGIFCAKSLLQFTVQRTIFSYSFHQSGQLSVRLLRAYLTAPYIFYLKRDIASIISNVTTHTHRFCYDYLIPLLQSISNFVVLTVLLALLTGTSPVLLAMLSLIILLVFLTFYSFRNRANTLGKEGADSYYQIIRVINHGLGGIKEAHVIGCEDYFQDQMQVQARRFERASTSFYSFQSLPKIAIESVLVLFIILIVSIQMASGQNITALLPTLSVFAVASIRLMPAASQFISAIGQLNHTSPVLDFLYQDLKDLEYSRQESRLNAQRGSADDAIFLDTSASRLNPPRQDRAPDDSQFGSQFGSQSRHQTVIQSFNQVELQAVTYQYPEAQTLAIDHLSLSFKKGESIALIGKSGAGKTTLVDVILGLLEPVSGDIRVDGISIYPDLRSWQNLVGYIPQSIFLVDDTIEQNIAFGVPEPLIDRAKLRQVMQVAQLSEFVEQLPQGAKTSVGERGVRLSGGQRQRIGIARALYHDREILVLDEATAALDNETEQLVTESIQALSGTKTLIIIAHRLTTVKQCDRLYRIENGRIVQSGSYEDVVQRVPR